MEVDDLIMVSVDDHVVEPPDLFEGRLPAGTQDLAPRFITRADGTNAWAYEGAEIGNVALNAVAGRPPEEYGIEPTSFDELRPGYLRHPRAGQGHGRQRGAGVAVLPVLPAVLRPAVRPHRGQGRGPGHGAGLQRLAHRRVVRQLSRAGSSRAPCRPSGIPRCWPPRSGAPRPRAPTPSPSRRTRPSSAGPASTPTTGTRSGQACSDEDVVVCMHIGSSSQIVDHLARRPDRRASSP